jgi:predicted Zn-dependent peptidase
MRLFANQGGTYDIKKAPYIQLYNEYFGGSMNAIVFQEMRESRSLAYSAFAFQSQPGFLNRPYTYMAQIATQNDKLADACNAFQLIINDMPESESAFALAKQGIDARMRSERIIKDDIAWAYIQAKRLGLDHEARQDVYNAVSSLTLSDIVKFQQQNVKGLTYNYGILGDPEDIDMDYLKTLGRVVLLTTEDIFGY